jgi:3-dehydroquinate synthetase
MPDFSSDVIIKHMMQDKKVTNQQMTLILLHKIGSAFIDKNISVDVLKNYLNQIKN